MSRSITEEGASALAEVVKRAHLKELNIYMNDIGDGGVLKVRPSHGRLCRNLGFVSGLGCL